VFQTTRVNPSLREFTRAGEKMWTQFPPETFVGYRFTPGKLIGRRAVDPSYAVDIE
jgi:hypothetical protein